MFKKRIDKCYHSLQRQTDSDSIHKSWKYDENVFRAEAQNAKSRKEKYWFYKRSEVSITNSNCEIIEQTITEEYKQHVWLCYQGL